MFIQTIPFNNMYNFIYSSYCKYFDFCFLWYIITTMFIIHIHIVCVS